MNRIEFMAELSSLLQDIETEEREEALQYYNDYFDDAGVENEAAVIMELENPKKVADKIRAGLEGRDDESSEYRETGYADTRFEEMEHPATREQMEQEAEQNTEKSAYTYTYEDVPVQEAEKKPWTSKWLKILLIVLIVLIGCPIVLPMGAAIIVVILALLIALLAIVLAFLVSGIAIAGAGLIMSVYGIARLIAGIMPDGLGFLGAGFLLTALGAVMTVGIWWLAFKVIPPLFRGTVDLCRRAINRIRGKGMA